MKVFLDDVREVSDIYRDARGWVIARDIKIVIPLLEKGLVTVLSLDGDMEKIGDKDIPGGVELCDWMRMSRKWPTQQVLVHSSNPVKRYLMEMVIDQHFVATEGFTEC